MRADGSGVRVLTDNPWEERAATWIPFRNKQPREMAISAAGRWRGVDSIQYSSSPTDDP
jgi:hypothetical protein